MRAKFASLLLTLAGLTPCALSAQGMGLPAAGFAAGGTGLTSFYVLGFELGPWQEYLAQELTPSYLMADNALPVHVSWLQYTDVAILPDFASGLLPEARTRMKMNYEFQSSGVYFAPQAKAGSASLMQANRFERQLFAPGFDQQIGDNGVLGVAAVIAYQRYSTSALGMLTASTAEAGQGYAGGRGYSPFAESGYGTGVRLELRQELFAGLALETGFQSRIDMEEFYALRGVFSNPADLDIPARARVGLAMQASQRSSFSVAIERVLYSDINAFPSRFLPNRFLSLLGDSTSPSFNWQDLTVYSVGWSWSDGDKQQWNIDLSTRPQPSPTSSVLSQTLKGDVANSAMTLGYSRRTGRNSHLNLAAAYAPSEYAFGGSVLGVTTEDLDQQFEIEAFWSMSF